MQDFDKIFGVKNKTVAVTAVSKIVSNILRNFDVRYFLRIKFNSKLT